MSDDPIATLRAALEGVGFNTQDLKGHLGDRGFHVNVTPPGTFCIHTLYELMRPGAFVQVEVSADGENPIIIRTQMPQADD